MLGVSALACAEEARFTNSLGMEMLRIAPGQFQMGSDAGGDFDERPAHAVTISQAFHLGATEVTNAQYEQFDPEHKKLRGKLGFSTGDDEAVVFVSWQDAARFCEWLATKEKKPYRLPTEAEWEYACRAGTTTAYATGDTLPAVFEKNAKECWFPDPEREKDGVATLAIAQTPANPWGLFDMHGNVEEWCSDWYGPYAPGDQTDPVGRAEGDFRVTRGGAHSTELPFLRSANRLGALPEDKSWVIGFRVAMGPMPATKPLPSVRFHQDVRQDIPPDLAKGPDPAKPYFKGPREYVKIAPNSNGPLFSEHNHCPAIVPCPNGDLFAIWYSCNNEPGRELGIACSRLRHGQEEWEPAVPFWDTPDRNDHASALYLDDTGTIWHFNGVSAAATWGSLATILRTSKDSGATWSTARIIMPEHNLHHMPVESVIRTRTGALMLPCDAVTGGKGGTAVLISRDNGQTWSDPGEGKPQPRFEAGATGAWIAGIHAAIVELADGRIMALGRNDAIGGHMPKSISSDGGVTWTYSASAFPPIGGGQRLTLLRLAEGPIFLSSFVREFTVRDGAGKERKMSGLFGALSYDEGETWPVQRLITDGQPARKMDGGGNTDNFLLGPNTAEPRGYFSVCQTPDGVIQLISSKQHYAFNVAWLKTPPPPETR